MSKGIKCICIDAKNKPKEIPTNKWVVENNTYTINHIFKHPNQNNIQGVELAELDISACKPYSTFRISRFAINVDDLGKLIQMMKDCTELNDIEIDSFIKEMLEKEELILEEN
jgi:hypothetical protein